MPCDWQVSPKSTWIFSSSPVTLQRIREIFLPALQPALHEDSLKPSPILCDHRCRDECPVGTYGPQCAHKCDCQNGAKCYHINGACLCNEGFKGPSCQDRFCPNGIYGLLCDKDCPCKMANTLRWSQSLSILIYTVHVFRKPFKCSGWFNFWGEFFSREKKKQKP